MNFDRKRSFAAGAALVVVLAGGMAHAGTTNDAWITSKAKLALMTTEGVESNAINVDTVGRKITLHGTVATTEEKQKAEEAVRSIDGVSSVRNLLQVSSAGAHKGTNGGMAKSTAKKARRSGRQGRPRRSGPAEFAR